MSDDGGILAPRENPDLFGHESAEALLARVSASGRMPHGWLITGPRGIGKATLAFRFARHLLRRDEGGASLGLFGDEPQGLAMAPDDPVFRRVASEGHPDLFTVTRRPDKKGKVAEIIKIEESRKATDFLRMTPAEAGWRVVIVDAADDLNINAANALLKALEEPPERAIMLLVSHQPGRLLPTIRSRCCQLTLLPLKDEILAENLARLRPDLGGDERELLVHLASGSLGEALRLSEEGGIELFHGAIGLLRQWPRLDGKALHDMGDKMARGGDLAPFRSLMGLLQWWLGRLARNIAENRDQTELWPGERDLIARLAAARPLDHWVGAWRQVGALAEATEASHLDRKQALLTAFQALVTSPTWE